MNSKTALMARNPKLQLIGILLLLSILGMLKQNSGSFPTMHLFQIGAAVLTAIFAELAFFGAIGAEGGRSAIVTGLLCGMILVPGTKPHLIWFAATAAIASKLLFRTSSGRHIFNPAAAGLIFSSIFFGQILNWWGFSNVYVVIAAAGLLIYRLNRLSTVFSYIIFHFLGNSILSGNFGSQSLLSVNVFFAFIMLIEPKTSPSARRFQWVFGGACGLLSALFFSIIPSMEGDLLALMAVNSLRFTPFLNFSISGKSGNQPDDGIHFSR
jgi:Na+-translocating ferredoxin:NAD+ oxidoreductase RnfD subunit